MTIHLMNALLMTFAGIATALAASLILAMPYRSRKAAQQPVRVSPRNWLRRRP